MIRQFKKGETIPEKEYLYTQPYKGNFYVVIRRSDLSNQDEYGMYLVDKSGKVLHNFGSHPQINKEKIPEKQIDMMIKNIKSLGENMVRENTEIKNPFIDSVYNGQFTRIKEVAEKTVAEKIYNRVQQKKTELMDKIIGR